ncbi:hypothetical protein L6R49_05425 [Myxococcota bacterium]|nr:hypothetical protein [Myxococcota bacterium]
MRQGHDSELTRADALLMLVLDGEASEAERAELLALSESDARLAELGELREALRDALTDWRDDSVDVVAAVLMAIGAEDDWSPVSSALRESVAFEAPFDVSDLVMAAITPPPEPEPDMLLSALVDGELSLDQRRLVTERLRVDRDALDTLNAFAEQGRVVREGLTERVADVDLSGLWPAVAAEIGVTDPEHVPGWEHTSALVKEAVLAQGALSAEEEVALTAAILNSLPRPKPIVVEIPPPPAPVPLWKMLLTNPTLIAAVFAAVMMTVIQLQSQRTSILDQPATSPAKPELVAQVVTEPFADLTIQGDNEVEVTSLEYAPDVVVQVIQLEDGAPVLLMFDEGEGDEGATL